MNENKVIKLMKPREKQFEFRSKLFNVDKINLGEKGDLLIDLANWHDIISITMEDGVLNCALGHYIESNSNLEVKLVKFVHVVKKSEIRDRLRQFQEKKNGLKMLCEGETDYEKIHDLHNRIENYTIRIELLREILEE